jgi:hypothetical protein
MRVPQNDANFYREWWLKKFHNTTIKEVGEKHPEECKSGKWFALYPCTDEQYAEWKEWAVKQAAKDNGISIKHAQLGFWSIDLDCGPTVLTKKNHNE